MVALHKDWPWYYIKNNFLSCPLSPCLKHLYMLCWVHHATGAHVSNLSERAALGNGAGMCCRCFCLPEESPELRIKWGKWHSISHTHYLQSGPIVWSFREYHRGPEIWEPEIVMVIFMVFSCSSAESKLPRSLVFLGVADVCVFVILTSRIKEKPFCLSILF